MVMSALPLKGDMCGATSDVGYGANSGRAGQVGRDAHLRFQVSTQHDVKLPHVSNGRQDQSYELAMAEPTPIDVSHRRRLPPEAVVNLDWHNDMSRLILDINARIESAADDHARTTVIRRLREVLEK
jgi:hypothetical protein